MMFSGSTSKQCCDQAVCADFRTMGRTAFQRIFEVELFRQHKESSLGKQSAASLAQLWVDNVRVSPGSEQFSPAFIDDSLTVYQRALSKEPIRAAVTLCDQEYGHQSPFNSVYKMAAIVKKAVSSEKIEWAYLAVTDLVRGGLLNHDDLSVRSIQGSGGQRGLVELLVLKRTMLQHFLSEVLDGMNFLPAVKAALREKLASHVAYRKFVNPLKHRNEPTEEDEGSKVDMSWKAGWPASADLMLALIEVPPAMSALFILSKVPFVLQPDVV